MSTLPDNVEGLTVDELAKLIIIDMRSVHEKLGPNDVGFTAREEMLNSPHLEDAARGMADTILAVHRGEDVGFAEMLSSLLGLNRVSAEPLTGSERARQRLADTVNQDINKLQEEAARNLISMVSRLN